MTSEPRQLHLEMTSDPANLAAVRHELESFCAECGYDEIARGQIVLCVNEAMANITRHAYGGSVDRPVELDAEFSGRLLRLRLRDWGCGRKPPDRPKPRDPLCPGGVGMLCLGAMMDKITFSPQPDGMLLTMERRL